MHKKMLLSAAIAVGVFGLNVGVAGATHPHHLDTPGGCTDRNGKGFGTGQSHGDNTADPGDTTFHERVHKGEPGTHAFEQENNPVAVSGGYCES